MELTDKDIVDGLRRRDERVTRTYFYGFCRMAYYIYDKRYRLSRMPGMDFYSLAHEYYLSLDRHGFRQLEDRSPGVSLKTWMVGGFRFVLLDKLKEAERERRVESLEQRVERESLRFDVADDNFGEEVRKAVVDLCRSELLHDDKSALILQMTLVEGYKGKEVAERLGMTPSAVSQRFTRLMRDVVTPYFKRSFSFTDFLSAYMSMPEESTVRCEKRMEMPVENFTSRLHSLRAGSVRRVAPDFIDSLEENEVFVFGSDLAGTHSGPAASYALRNFGAVAGQGSGPQGRSYAIPTMLGGTENIRPYVDRFIEYAAAHPGQTFLVTRVGCGIAGFDDDDIAPLFRRAEHMDNVRLPIEFWENII